MAPVNSLEEWQKTIKVITSEGGWEKWGGYAMEAGLSVNLVESIGSWQVRKRAIKKFLPATRSLHP